MTTKTNPNQAPYPHLEDYRKMIYPNMKLHIPKNPNTRYRPPSWNVKKPTGYAKLIPFQDLEDTQRDLASHYAFVRAELASGLLTAPQPTIQDHIASCPL